MTEKTFQHSLRTITLKYDDSIPESDFERELIERYLEMHTKIEEYNKESARITFLHSELADLIHEGSRKFKLIDETISQFLKKAEAIAEVSDNLFFLRELDESMQNYHVNISDFHDNILQQIRNDYDENWDEYLKLIELDEKLTNDYDEYSKFRNPLYVTDPQWSLDLVSYDRDEQKMLGSISRLEKFLPFHRKIKSDYEEFVQTVNTAYSNWQTTRKIMSEAYDSNNLLDCSQSLSYANGTGDPKKRPIYMIPPGSPQIEEFKTNYGLLANPTKNSLTISVDMETVKSEDIYMIQEFILCLQHFPKLIEKFVFSINIQFLNHDDIPMKDEDWKGVSYPMKWFSLMQQLPCSIFFIQDPDARGYILLGDIMTSDEEFERTENEIKLEGKLLEKVCNRLFHSCFLFLLYCHNSGFNPQPYIEALIADFDLPITYKHVHQEYLKAVKQGIKIKAVPTKKGK
ncbi:MAG: hypothetical protein IPM47_17740 [Sphingobacteriales bacterium]|nr:MAG: hypothetical protein IPM47_17740 [Sphingobacteriales bacterium]